MNKNLSKTFVITLAVLGIIFSIAGASFAYLSASVVNRGGLKGNTFSFSVDLTVTPTKVGTLIPVRDNLITSFVNYASPCVDKNSLDVCSIYQLTLTNKSAGLVMNGFINTASTTYSTDNLKYQLFSYANNTYTAVSDIGVISRNTTDKRYFTLNSSNVDFALQNGTTTNYSVTYYLVLWLSDTNSNQLEDRNKTYTGKVGFISENGDEVSADFTQP